MQITFAEIVLKEIYEFDLENDPMTQWKFRLTILASLRINVQELSLIYPTILQNLAATKNWPSFWNLRIDL